MKKIKNWKRYDNKNFRVVDDEIKIGDYFLNDNSISICRFKTGVWLNGNRNVEFSEKIIFDDDAKMEFEEEKLPIAKTTPPKVAVNHIIYFLDGYDLLHGIVKSIGPKNVKIQYTFWNNTTRIYTVPFNKVAERDEMICVVWEKWKGVNGAGGYRIERTLYPEIQKKAENWGHQHYVIEYEFGTGDFHLLPGYKEKEEEENETETSYEAPDYHKHVQGFKDFYKNN